MMPNKINCFNYDIPSSFYEELPVVRTENQFQLIIKEISFKPTRKECTRFHLVRHEESEGKSKNLVAGGTDQDHLNPTGHIQAAKLAENILLSQNAKQNNFSAIFCSPANAAKDTADYVSKSLNISFETDDRLKQKHWGSFHGKPICESYKSMKVKGERASEELRTFKEKFDFKFEQEPTTEETLQEVFNRIVHFMGNIAKEGDFQGKEIIVITHTPVLKAVFSAILACESQRDLEYQWYDFSNGAKVLVDVNPSGETSLAGIEGIRFRGSQKY